MYKICHGFNDSAHMMQKMHSKHILNCKSYYFTVSSVNIIRVNGLKTCQGLSYANYL